MYGAAKLQRNTEFSAEGRFWQASGMIWLAMG